MRTFFSLREAAREIRRDIYKAPAINSSRVQSVANQDFRTNEWTNYSYSIDLKGMPDNFDEFLDTACEMMPFWAQNRGSMANWLSAELNSRVIAAKGYNIGRPDLRTGADMLNPELVKYVEGSTFSYIYAERLFGLIPVMQACFAESPDTRRAYWPIFHPMDSLRASNVTRVPCTLGYQFLLREFPGEDFPRFEIVVFSRSVDYDKYWISDVWLASMIGRHLYTALADVIDNLEWPIPSGTISHHIGSFHRFIPEDEETF